MCLITRRKSCNEAQPRNRESNRYGALGPVDAVAAPAGGRWTLDWLRLRLRLLAVRSTSVFIVTRRPSASEYARGGVPAPPPMLSRALVRPPPTLAVNESSDANWADGSAASPRGAVVVGVDTATASGDALGGAAATLVGCGSVGRRACGDWGASAAADTAMTGAAGSSLVSLKSSPLPIVGTWSPAARCAAGAASTAIGSVLAAVAVGAAPFGGVSATAGAVPSAAVAATAGAVPSAAVAATPGVLPSAAVAAAVGITMVIGAGATTAAACVIATGTATSECAAIGGPITRCSQNPNSAPTANPHAALATSGSHELRWEDSAAWRGLICESTTKAREPDPPDRGMDKEETPTGVEIRFRRCASRH
jgi:hypothetical protein